MSIFIRRSVFVDTRLFVLQTNSCMSCTAEAKVLFKVCLWAKILLSIANSTSQCSAQNLVHLGSKATNRSHDRFPTGHDQRSRCQIFERALSACFNVIGCLQKNFAIFCFQLENN